MLNPSTADAELDDPTIRRCKNYCLSLGFDVLRGSKSFCFPQHQSRGLKEGDINPVGSNIYVFHRGYGGHE